MQHRPTTAALSLILLAATALAGCTSGETEDQTTSTAGPTTEAAKAGGNEWFCRLIKKDAVDAATGGRSAEATEVIAIDEEDVYQCDVLLPTSGGETEVVMSVGMQRDALDEADALLAEVMAIEGAKPGPSHLGVSYVADTLAVSVVPCKSAPDATGASAEVPYVFTIRAPLDTEGAVTDLLDQPLTRMVREMDQSVGCSPSKIHPVDNAETTSAP